MRVKELDLEYEFDMDDVFVISMLITTLLVMGIWGVYITTDIFNWSFAIPFMLLLIFYVVLDEHNDQIKERNDVKISHVLEMNNNIQYIHKTAIKYV